MALGSLGELRLHVLQDSQGPRLTFTLLSLSMFHIDHLQRRLSCLSQGVLPLHLLTRLGFAWP